MTTVDQLTHSDLWSQLMESIQFISPNGKLVQIEVGKPHPKLKFPMIEGGTLFFKNGTLDIVIGYTEPTPREVRNMKAGAMRIGLYDGGNHTLFLCLKMGDLEWMDFPFSVGRNVAGGFDDARFPPIEDGCTQPIFVTLVEARSNIVRALRIVGPPRECIDELERLLEKQRQSLPDYSQEAHDAEIGATYRRFRRSSDMAARHWVIGTASGS